MARPGPEEQLQWAQDLALTQQILGTIGFVVNMSRPDAAFAYNALSRYSNTQKFTPLVLRFAHRVARYLLATIDLHLTIHSPPRATLASGGTGLDLFHVDVDSSHANGEGGLSYGGFVLLSTAAGGGAIAWKSTLPREAVDSTGAAELRLCTHALKYVVAVRMLQTELNLGVAPTKPTVFATDAQAVIAGAGLERITRTSRWQAARYGMMRWGIETHSIELTKKDGILMVADILTKPVTGAHFHALRSVILGLPQITAGGSGSLGAPTLDTTAPAGIVDPTTPRATPPTEPMPRARIDTDSAGDKQASPRGPKSGDSRKAPKRDA